jgi:hypothetical protein
LSSNISEILINYLQDFFFQSVLVGFVGFLGIVYLVLLESGSGYSFFSFCSKSYITLFWGGEWFPSLFFFPIFLLGNVSIPRVHVI